MPDGGSIVLGADGIEETRRPLSAVAVTDQQEYPGPGTTQASDDGRNRNDASCRVFMSGCMGVTRASSPVEQGRVKVVVVVEEIGSTKQEEANPLPSLSSWSRNDRNATCFNFKHGFR